MSEANAKKKSREKLLGQYIACTWTSLLQGRELAAKSKLVENSGYNYATSHSCVAEVHAEMIMEVLAKVLCKCFAKVLILDACGQLDLLTTSMVRIAIAKSDNNAPFSNFCRLYFGFCPMISTYKAISKTAFYFEFDTARQPG